MAVASESAERIDVSQPMDPSPSSLISDLTSESLSTARPSFSTDTPDRYDSANSSPNNAQRDADPQVWEKVTGHWITGEIL
uniref:Uncharacterized protein n=1 Tax=Fagus sylvatica TaxID=28930 RepID=A0A2N9GJW3_FAGSY